MTTRCWKEDPIERPTVDEVLEALRIAAELWNPKYGGLSTLSQDDWSPTLFKEESDSPTAPKPENKPVTDNASPPPPPSTAKNGAPPKSIPTTSEKEDIQSAPTRLLKYGRVRPAPIEQSKEGGEPKPTPSLAILREEQTRSVPIRASREEESGPAPFTSKETKHTSVSRPEAQLKPIPVAPRKDETKEVAPLNPKPVIPKKEEVNPVPISLFKEVSFKPTVDTPGKKVARSIPASSRKEGPSSGSAPTTSLREGDDNHTSITRSKGVRQVRPKPIPATLKEEGAEEEGSFKPAPTEQGETRPTPTYPRRMESKPKEGPAEREPNPLQHPVYQSRAERHPKAPTRGIRKLAKWLFMAFRAGKVIESHKAGSRGSQSSRQEPEREPESHQSRCKFPDGLA